MAVSDPFTTIGAGVFRTISAILGRRPVIPEKHLQSRIVARCIISELPQGFPLQVTDLAGSTHKGIYALNVLIWNKGAKEILPSDFLDNAPLKIAVNKESYIIMMDHLSNDDQLTCSLTQVNEQYVEIYFDCINPGDHINIILYYGGNSMAEVEILGRVRGQATSIDHLAEEVKASLGERLCNLFILLFIVNMFIGLPISIWIIYRDHGFEKLFHIQPDIPPIILGSFTMGLMLVFMFLWSRIGGWLERRKYPVGYPLHSDFEPPFMENIKGMILTVFTAKKHRLSTSLFDWAKPVIVYRKKSKRRSVEDWII